MSITQINKKTFRAGGSAITALGFRPFFLGASLFGSISILLWLLLYSAKISLPLNRISLSQWHSHEMVYGYSIAVIAGFLLTAVMNWTGVQTLHGRSLGLLFTLWVVARISFAFGNRLLPVAAAADIFFMLFLLYAVASPIIKARQWRQLGILSKIVLLTLGNTIFYLGAFGVVERGVYWGIYGGLYLIIGLILTIGSRVVPRFIENGVDEDVTIPNPRWISAVGLVLFFLFFINQLFFQNRLVVLSSSVALLGVNSYRLYLWHTGGIWRKALLWSLYLAFVSIDLGFLLFALSALYGVSPFLAIHAFAFGGIGLATLGMMSRVTLGHTGRNVRKPPVIIGYALALMVLGVIVRVGLPLFDPLHYASWIFYAQVSWILAFFMFFLSHAKMLVMPRIDGQPG